jgi:hypothetical protein
MNPFATTFRPLCSRASLVLTRGSFVFLGFGNRSRWRHQQQHQKRHSERKTTRFQDADDAAGRDYIQMGNRVVMIVKFHNNSITDPEERRKERAGFGEAKNKLVQCGVEFGEVKAHWV